MAMDGFTKDMNIIQKLNDEPNDRDGLTAGELKAKFDEGGLAVKDYLNNTVKPFADGLEADEAAHEADTNNPHGVTKAQVGLGSVPDVSTNDQTPTYTAASSLTALVSGEKLSIAFGKLAKAVSSLISHLADSTKHITAAERTNWNSKAAGSHTHSADDVTSGTLPVARGGTGKTTTLEALTYLGGASIKSIGTAIDAGTDLNALITPGTYYSFNADRSATLVNAPFTSSGFKLFVVTSYQAARVIQYAIIAASIAVRYCNNATGASPSWSDWDSFSRKTHTHDAADITSGTLPVARGGTGQTTAAAAASALLSELNDTSATLDVTDNTLIATSSSTGETGTWYRRAAVKFWNYIKTKADAVYAAISHTHAVGDITSGTLPAARGGTGETTLNAAASALLVALTQITSTAATADVSDDTLIATSAATGETETWYRRPATKFWNYIKTKTDALYAVIGHTHTVPSLGGGYATCSTAAGTFAKTASLSGYTLKPGGIVVVKFTKGSTCVVSDTNPNVTLNINSTGAKPIKYRDAALDNDTIKANNYITFVYDGTNYNIISSSRGVANTFRGATSSEAGTIGIVPQPPAGANVKYLCGDGTWAVPTTQSSDARLKDVQGDVPDCSSVRAVRFKWKDGHDDKEHIGYLAQEVEKIAPYLVGDDSNGYKNLDYLALLCAKVEMLERRVAELEGGDGNGDS